MTELTDNNDMNRYYTETIPVALSEKLKAKGMPIETEGENVWCPSYAEVFDWFSNKGIHIAIVPRWRFSTNSLLDFMLLVNQHSFGFESDWQVAADKMIKEALLLI